jgi:hypothetical protein
MRRVPLFYIFCINIFCFLAIIYEHIELLTPCSSSDTDDKQLIIVVVCMQCKRILEKLTQQREEMFPVIR